MKIEPNCPFIIPPPVISPAQPPVIKSITNKEITKLKEENHKWILKTDKERQKLHLSCRRMRIYDYDKNKTIRLENPVYI
jgi:hypothetical protein